MSDVMEKVAHLDWRTLMKASDDMPEQSLKALDKYFNQFVAVPLKASETGGKPETLAQKCVGCGETLTGFEAMFGRGGFQWGIIHGQGHCAKCKWPAFGHHFIKDDEGNDVVTLHNLVLQVHPDFVDHR